MTIGFGPSGPVISAALHTAVLGMQRLILGFSWLKILGAWHSARA